MVLLAILEKNVHELAQIARMLLEFKIEKDTIKNSLDFQLTRVNGTNVTLTDKKVHEFSIAKIGRKGKRPLMNPLETLMIRGQQSFELHDQINPIQIRTDDDRVVNTLKKLQAHIINLCQYEYYFLHLLQTIQNKIF